jgi:hypothetical protein
VYDQGEYTCVAKNTLGKEKVVASPTLIPDPTYRRREAATPSWLFNFSE